MVEGLEPFLDAGNPLKPRDGFNKLTESEKVKNEE